MTSFDLVEPRTLEEALGHLDAGDPAIRPIGGGTALMLMMKAQMFKPVRLVSLRRLGAQFDGIDALVRCVELPHRRHDDASPHSSIRLRS